MATLVLGAVGTVLGGPAGGALGALAGRAFDSAVLFKPKGRRGPRLQDLAVQTSTYGSQIPKVFGTMRVAGTVIWATDLRESATKNGGGKGQPSVTTYSYSASFAVALSARTVRSVGRIWADGNLLRGAAGDFKTELGAFRLHDGSEDQAADPLIAAAEGIGLTPAHRGIAYAVFEELALADFGNRIPSLTFEVLADEGAVRTGAIAAVLSNGKLGDGTLGGAGGAVGGYAASGDDVAAALQPLIEAQGLVLDGLRLGYPEAAGTVPRAILTAAAKAARDPAGDVPVRLSVRHYEPERDYQAGVQSAVRPGVGRAARSMEIPAAISAQEAKALAAARLSEAWTERSRLELTCGPEALVYRPGTVLSVEGMAGLWRVVALEWETSGVRLELRGWRSGNAVPVEAAAGSAVKQPDMPHGATSLMLVDLPVLTDSAPAAPVVMVAAAGASAGWRKAALFTVDAGGTAEPMGRTAPAAVMGTVVAPPGEGSAALFDMVASLDVQLLLPGASLSGAEEAALLRGANMCLVGRELIQFAAASAIGPGLFRLRRLLRGRRGTEWAMVGHEAGENFLLLDAERLAVVPQVAAQRGMTCRVIGIGIGDAEPAAGEIIVAGEALMPLSPVHLHAQSDGAGGLAVRWMRRSRAGWGWSDGADVPLSEETERYRVEVLAGEVVLRSVEVGAPFWTYAAGIRAEDVGASFLSVRQIGTHGPGRAARIVL